MTRRCPDTHKMKAIFNRPQVPLEDGIRRLAEHRSRSEGRRALSRRA